MAKIWHYRTSGTVGVPPNPWKCGWDCASWMASFEMPESVSIPFALCPTYIHFSLAPIRVQFGIDKLGLWLYQFIPGPSLYQGILDVNLSLPHENKHPGHRNPAWNVADFFVQDFQQFMGGLDCCILGSITKCRGYHQYHDRALGYSSMGYS